MLTKVEVDNLQGGTLSLPLQNPTSGFYVKEIEGLDPVKASIVTSSFAQLDGSQFQNSSRDNRNIILTIGIEPYYGASTVRELRSALYAFFMPKTTVSLGFFEDGVHFVDIQGVVESCEAAIFSKDPEVVVSIVCFNPNFVAPDSVTVTGNTVSGDTEQTIAYEGTIETGFLFSIAVNRTISDFTIYNRRPSGEVRQFPFSASLIADDVVEISTQARQKSAVLTRASADSSILYAVDPHAIWLNLWPGDNFIRVLTSGAAIPWSIEYTPKYGGL